MPTVTGTVITTISEGPVQEGAAHRVRVIGERGKPR